MYVENKDEFYACNEIKIPSYNDIFFSMRTIILILSLSCNLPVDYQETTFNNTCSNILKKKPIFFIRSNYRWVIAEID